MAFTLFSIWMLLIILERKTCRLIVQRRRWFNLQVHSSALNHPAACCSEIGGTRDLSPCPAVPMRVPLDGFAPEGAKGNFMLSDNFINRLLVFHYLLNIVAKRGKFLFGSHVSFNFSNTDFQPGDILAIIQNSLSNVRKLGDICLRCHIGF